MRIRNVLTMVRRIAEYSQPETASGWLKRACFNLPDPVLPQAIKTLASGLVIAPLVLPVSSANAVSVSIPLPPQEIAAVDINADNLMILQMELGDYLLTDAIEGYLNE